MDSRDRAREPGQRARTKPVEEGKLRDRPRRSGLVPREDLPPVEAQNVVKNRELEPSEDFARRGDIETERRDHEGPSRITGAATRSRAVRSSSAEG